MARGLTIGAVACVALLAAWLLSQQSSEEPSSAVAPGAEQQSQETELTEPIRPAFSSPPATATCEPYDPHAHLSEAEASELWERESAMLVDVLGASDDAEHVATAATILATRQPSEAAELLDRAAALAPGDPLISWLRLQQCGQMASDCGGRLDSVERAAVRVDGGNAAVWASIAVIRLRGGDTPGATEALRLAAGASDYNAWVSELVLLFDRGQAAASSEQSLVRLVRAFAFASSVYSTEVFVIQPCKEQAVHSADWLSYCTRLGENMTHHARNYLHRSIGFSLLEAMYELDGDTRRREAAERQRAALIDKFKSTSAGQWDYLSRDEALLRAHLDVWAASDEIAALEFVEDEIERLSTVPGYDPCELPNPGG